MNAWSFLRSRSFARAAAARLDGERRVPGTQAGAEAMAARAVFDALAAGFRDAVAGRQFGELAWCTPVDPHRGTGPTKSWASAGSTKER